MRKLILLLLLTLPLWGATSYGNPFGSGDRSAALNSITGITVFSNLAYGGTGSNPNSLFNGSNANVNYFNNGQSSGYLGFAFQNYYVIDEVKWYQSGTQTHGTWQWEGMCALGAACDGTTWTSIGNTFTLGGATTQTQTTLNGNTTAYRYYRLRITAGATSNGPYLQEIEFQIDTGTAGSVTTFATGDRTASITVTTAGLACSPASKLVDGNTGTTCYMNSGTLNGSQYIRFQFLSAKKVDDAFWLQNANSVASTPNGVWQWQGSNDGSGWSNIGGT